MERILLEFTIFVYVELHRSLNQTKTGNKTYDMMILPSNIG